MNSPRTPISELVELIELTQDALDNIWYGGKKRGKCDVRSAGGKKNRSFLKNDKLICRRLSVSPPYSETRMKHVMHVISTALGGCIAPQLVFINPWSDSFSVEYANPLSLLYLPFLLFPPSLFSLLKSFSVPPVFFWPCTGYGFGGSMPSHS